MTIVSRYCLCSLATSAARARARFGDYAVNSTRSSGRDSESRLVVYVRRCTMGRAPISWALVAVLFAVRASWRMGSGVNFAAEFVQALVH